MNKAWFLLSSFAFAASIHTEQYTWAFVNLLLGVNSCLILASISLQKKIDKYKDK